MNTRDPCILSTIMTSNSYILDQAGSMKDNILCNFEDFDGCCLLLNGWQHSLCWHIIQTSGKKISGLFITKYYYTGGAQRTKRW